MNVSDFPTVTSVALLERIVTNGARTARPTCIIGLPGLGKTAIVRGLAQKLGLEFCDLDLGNGAREDMMLPVTVDAPGGKVVVRIPLDALKRACEVPALLFVDEITRSDRNKQAVAMALCHERRIGSFLLHPNTVVVFAGNDSSSGGTYALNDALVNRCCVVGWQPSRDDMRGHLATLGADGSTLRKLATKYSAVADMRTELLQPTPPEDSVGLYATPRAVDHALSRLASHLDNGGALDDGCAVEFAGVVGMGAAAAWFAVLANDTKLPTVEDVCKTPDTARLPPDLESAIAGLGVLALALKVDPNATWTYLGHYAAKWPEAAGAACKACMSRPPTNPAALKVFQRLAGKAQASLDRTR